MKNNLVEPLLSNNKDTAAILPQIKPKCRVGELKKFETQLVEDTNDDGTLLEGGSSLVDTDQFEKLDIEIQGNLS